MTSNEVYAGKSTPSAGPTRLNRPGWSWKTRCIASWGELTMSAPASGPADKRPV